jgi:nucleotide-binding universal stress UspA family protein
VIYRTIVVGYRPDEHGEDALALARVLAGARSTERVTVVEIVDGSRSHPKAVDPPALDWPAHVEVAARAVKADAVADALRSIGAEESADIVVLGSTHRGLAGRVFAGTTASALFGDAPWPIVIAPRNFRGSPAPIRTVGVAFDNSSEAQAALDWAAEVAVEFSAAMRLIGVVAPPLPAEAWAGSVPGEAWAGGLSIAESMQVSDNLRDRSRGDLERARASVGRSDAETVTVVGDVVAGLRDAAEQLDLLVVGTHHEELFGRLLMGSVSRGLAHGCPAPLAAVPRNAG